MKKEEEDKQTSWKPFDFWLLTSLCRVKSAKGPSQCKLGPKNKQKVLNPETNSISQNTEENK